MSQNNDLKKALHRAIMKAYKTGEQARKKAIQDIVHDVQDPNMHAEVPEGELPAASEGVLNKDVTLSEMHQQKQANAMAKLGQTPKTPKLSQMPGTPKMPSPSASPSSSGAPKAPKPLQSFMQKKEDKRKQGSMGLDKSHQPHPGPSKSSHQEKFDSKKQSEQEAHLKSPKGEEERKERNAKMVASFKDRPKNIR